MTSGERLVGSFFCGVLTGALLFYAFYQVMGLAR